MKKKTLWTIIASLILSWILVHCILIINGVFTVGEELTKSDWLSFLGAYLGLLGTVILGAIALRQNQIFKEENDKSQGRINQINSELMQMQMANLMPFINVQFEDILKPFSAEEKRMRGIPEDQFMNGFMIDTGSFDYILTLSPDNIKKRLGMMVFDPEFQEMIADNTHLDLRLRKVKLTNIGNNAAADITITLNGESVLRSYNLAVNSSLVYYMVFSKEVKTIDYAFDIKFKALDKNTYIQSFRYTYSIPDIAEGVGATFDFNGTKFPQKLDNNN